MKTEDLQLRLINGVKPDLVVITGDAVSGDKWDKKQRVFYHRNWRKFTEAMLFTRTKYIYILGSSDNKGDLTNE